MHSPNKHVSNADSIAICECRHNLHILSAISCPGGFSLDSSYCCGSDSLHLQCSKKRSQLQVSCYRLGWYSSLFRCLNTVLACINSFLHVLYFAQSMLCEASVITDICACQLLLNVMLSSCESSQSPELQDWDFHICCWAWWCLHTCLPLHASANT